MDIKSLLGDAWKDGMTVDEINQALADKTFVDPTTLPKSVNKETFDKTASELAKLKKEMNELKTASMSDAEKLKQAQDEAFQLKTQYQKEVAKIRAREVFVKAGLADEEYSSILEGIVSENEEVTMALAKNMVELIGAQKTLTEKKIREQLLKETPAPPPGRPTPPKGERERLIMQYDAAEKRYMQNKNISEVALMQSLDAKIKALPKN